MKEEIKKALLRKLFKHGYIGGRHTSFDNLPKGFPSNLVKEIKKVAKEFITEGLLIGRPTSYGLQVSLNPRKLKEIKRLIQE